jgi:RNA polymerase sigma-B factor
MVSAPTEAPEMMTEAADGASTGELFEVLARLPAGHPDWHRTRERIIERHLPLVRLVARRYSHRGEPFDDLFQAGALGLVKAVDRFDVDRGLSFSTFAVPTVQGEIKRHFRDRTWSVHVNRGLQERVALVSRASTELNQELGRAPTVAETAARTGISDEHVLEALECARSYSTRSLNETVGDADGAELSETLGAEDPGLQDIVLHESLRPALARLPAREQRILQLRFYGGQTQSQIAAQLGISQMHVSRLLARTLATLRRDLAD